MKLLLGSVSMTTHNFSLLKQTFFRFLSPCNMLVLKIKTKEQIRRISFEQPPKFVELLKILLQLYQDSAFKIKYLDDENDLVTITNDLEFQEAIHCIQGQSQPLILRLFLEKSNNKYSEKGTICLLDSCTHFYAEWNELIVEELSSSLANSHINTTANNSLITPTKDEVGVKREQQQEQQQQQQQQQSQQQSQQSQQQQQQSVSDLEFQYV